MSDNAKYKVGLSISGEPPELKLGGRVHVIAEWDDFDGPVRTEGIVVALSRSSGFAREDSVVTSIEVRLIDGPHPGYVVYLPIPGAEERVTIPEDVLAAQQVIREHYEDAEHYGRPKPVSLSTTMKCNLCEPPDNAALDMGWEPFSCPLDEIGITLMKQHLESEHSVEGLRD